ncbi:head-tail connector protein [Microvirga subterranea]|uniref:Putative phiE125 gp8 family phage protein n=1 Tax=Microvirga subterranea TaxID=186651 RepID=A0A370H5K4_9HYPH|nr:head-tail connector protein [Microvirga subterranea]RDI51228.1 putative phiE125 gp8 family phage protein [Microvirga subterranea]
MRLQLITPPAVEPVTLDEVKDHLRVTNDLEDDLLSNLITTARQKLDGPRGLLGRALITQTWTATLDGFPRVIDLPFAPVSAVSAITYRDTTGIEQTLAADAYMVAGLLDDHLTAISPVCGKSWPFIPYSPGRVSVTFTAGYGDAPEDVPEPIRTAIKMLVGHLYKNREAVTVASGSMMETPIGWQDLVADYRIRGF